MSNEGLRHLPQRIFGYLDRKSLLVSREVCHDWKQFVDDPKNQECRKPWIRLLEMALEDRMYVPGSHSVTLIAGSFRQEFRPKKLHGCYTLFEACPDWKEICHYLQTRGSLPNFMVFSEGLDECHSTEWLESLFMGTGAPRNPIDCATCGILGSRVTRFIKTLLTCPILPNALCQPNVLHFASDRPNHELIQHILEKILHKELDIDVNAKDEYGKSAFDKIVDANNSRSLKVILDYTESLGIITHSPNDIGMPPFERFMKYFTTNANASYLGMSVIDLWMEQDKPVEFSVEAFKSVDNRLLSFIIEDVFVEKPKIGKNTQTILKKLVFGKPKRFLTGSLNVDTNRCDLPLIIAELCQERREAFMKAKEQN